MDQTVTDTIGRFLAHREGRGLAAATLVLYRRQLGAWADWRERQRCAGQLRAVTLDELDAFFRYLAREHIPHASNPRRPAAGAPGLAPETVAAHRRVLRALWTFARARGWLAPHQADYFGRDGVQAPRVPEPPRPVYDPGELAAMLAACGDGQTEESARDRALVALLWESGARITELLSVDDEGVQLGRRRARVTGKGGLARYLRWGPVAQHELLRYRQRRRGGEGGPLFRATGPRAGASTRFSTDTARSRFKRLMTDAGLEPAPGSPLHAFRRGFIQRGIADGADLSEVSQLAGHRDVRTTMRYARQTEDRLDQVYEERYVRRRGRAPAIPDDRG